MLLFCIFYLFTEKTLDLQVLDLIEAVSFRLVCWGMRTWMYIHQYTFHCLSSLKTEFELIKPIFIFDLFFFYSEGLYQSEVFLSIEINHLILLCWREYYYENRKRWGKTGKMFIRSPGVPVSSLSLPLLGSVKGLTHAKHLLLFSTSV